MAQQTAVDWFEKNYHELLVEASINNMHVVLFDKKRGELFEQAKAMEKEQRVRDYNVGYTDAQCNHVNDAENYANEQEYLNNKL